MTAEEPCYEYCDFCPVDRDCNRDHSAGCTGAASAAQKREHTGAIDYRIDQAADFSSDPALFDYI